MYYGCCQKRSSHLGAVGWVDVGRLGGQLSLQRSDLASGIQTHLRGEAGRLYKLVGKGTMSFALCVPIWSISVWNRAENMWILLTDWSKSFASSSSRNWFSIFSPSKWTSHWFFCLILFFGFGNHWLFFFFLTPLKFFLFIFGCTGFSLLCGLLSGCGEPGLLFVAVRGRLTVVACLVAEHRL